MSYKNLKVTVPGDVTQLSKLAQMDVQESQLEQDFSKLAFMFVADRAAQLMRYLLGFEVVEHEPDGSKAVGVFGFKVGEDYYYIPAFFITNQVRGIDMIFSKKTNMFFPISEEWVDNIIQRDAIELGNAADARAIRPDFENPNFDFVRRPDIGTAYSSKTAAARDAAGYDEYEEGKSLFKAAWDAMCYTTAEKLANDAELRASVSGFIGALNGKELSKKAEAGDLSRWLSERGGPAAVSSLFDALCTNVKFANAALSVYPNIETLHVSTFKPTAYGCKKAEEPKLKLMDSASDDTTLADKQRLLVNGFFIDDNRDAQDLSRVYDYDHAATFTKVDDPGKYDVLEADGTTRPMWVLNTIRTHSGEPSTLVVTDAAGSLKLRGICTSDSVYGKARKLVDVDSLYSTAIPLSQMAEGYSYILIDKSGKHCIPSATIRGVSYTPGENLRINATLDYISCGGGTSPQQFPQGGDFDIYRNDRYRDREGHLLDRGYGRCGDSFAGFTITKNTGKAVIAGNRILVPSNYKAIMVDAPWDVKHRRDEDDSRPIESSHGIESKDQDPEDPHLGDITSLRFEMAKSAFHDLTVLKDGPEFYVRIDDLGISRPFNYKQACMSLNGRLGLSVDDTERVLAKAAEAGEYKTHIHLGKAAQFVGVNMPMPPPEAPSADPYTGTPVYGPYEEAVQAPFEGAPPVPHGNPYGENLGGEGETQQGYGANSPGGGRAAIDPEAINLATQAGELGQRHVFDYSSIGGLAKVYDTGALIDSYVPQFMQALDRLGRVLFLYYWKNEDFGERYGTSDTVELEDTLRSVFKQFGNLALKLRSKTIDGNQ